MWGFNPTNELTTPSKVGYEKEQPKNNTLQAYEPWPDSGTGIFGLAVLSKPALAGSAGVIGTCADGADRIALLCVSKTRVSEREFYGESA